MSDIFVDKTDNFSITEDPVESQRRARQEFERMWAVFVGFDLPIRVGDAWWPMTAGKDPDLAEWRRIGEEHGWITIS